MSRPFEDPPASASLDHSNTGLVTQSKEVPVKRLEQLRRQIQAETYRIDADLLADALLRSAGIAE